MLTRRRTLLCPPRRRRRAPLRLRPLWQSLYLDKLQRVVTGEALDESRSLPPADGLPADDIPRDINGGLHKIKKEKRRNEGVQDAREGIEELVARGSHVSHTEVRPSREAGWSLPDALPHRVLGHGQSRVAVEANGYGAAAWGSIVSAHPSLKATRKRHREEETNRKGKPTRPRVL